MGEVRTEIQRYRGVSWSPRAHTGQVSAETRDQKLEGCEGPRRFPSQPFMLSVSALILPLHLPIPAFTPVTH